MDPQAPRQSRTPLATSSLTPSATLSDKMRYSDPEAPDILRGTLEAIREGGAIYRAKLAAKPTTTGD